MEKVELYKKVYIRSEDDLPKIKGQYICHEKTYVLHLWSYDPTIIESKKYWQYVDWYLAPIDDKQPEQTLPMECRTCKVIQGHLDGC